MKKCVAEKFNTRADGWISIEDELPNNGESVLTIGTDEHGKMMHPITATHINGDFRVAYQFSGSRHISFMVQTFPTHWMPLPKPPAN